MLHALRFLGASAASLALLSGTALAASERATAAASAQIVSSGGIQVISPLVLPTVTATGLGGVGFAGEFTTVGASGSVYGNARLTIRREAGEALSLIVPSTFTVVRTGGSEALTVTTSTTSDFGVVGDGILLDGDMMHGTATSVDIGGRLALAAADGLVPGPYEGLFAVVVEYN
jgi:hypothetical protein